MTFIVDWTEADADTGGSTQDITISGFGTPVAAEFWVTYATADATDTAHASISVGFTDGTNQFTAAGSSENGQSSTDSYREMFTDEVIGLLDPTDGSILCEANFDSWVTDGVRINWGVTPPAAYKIVVILYGGTDASAYVGNVSTSSGDVNITAIGFEPDIVKGISTRGALPGNSSSLGFGMGICVNDGVTDPPPQFSLNIVDIDNRGSAEGAMIGEDDNVARNLSGTSTFGGVQCKSFDSSGFTAGQVSGSGTNMGYLAISWGAASVTAEVVQTTSAGSTGLQSFTSLGTQATHVQLVGSGMTSGDWGSLQNSAGYVMTFGLGVSTPGSDDVCVYVASEDGAGTSNTWSRIDAGHCIRVTDNAGGAVMEATVNTNASGFDLNISAQTDQHEFIYLALEQDSGSAAQNITQTALATVAVTAFSGTVNAAQDISQPTTATVVVTALTGSVNDAENVSQPATATVAVLALSGSLKANQDIVNSQDEPASVTITALSGTVAAGQTLSQPATATVAVSALSGSVKADQTMTQPATATVVVTALTGSVAAPTSIAQPATATVVVTAYSGQVNPGGNKYPVGIVVLGPLMNK